jgi:hypothetical protein
MILEEHAWKSTDRKFFILFNAKDHFDHSNLAMTGELDEINVPLIFKHHFGEYIRRDENLLSFLRSSFLANDEVWPRGPLVKSPQESSKLVN